MKRLIALFFLVAALVCIPNINAQAKEIFGVTPTKELVKGVTGDDFIIGVSAEDLIGGTSLGVLDVDEVTIFANREAGGILTSDGETPLPIIVAACDEPLDIDEAGGLLTNDSIIIIGRWPDFLISI